MPVCFAAFVCTSVEGLFMLKNITRQLFAQLSRHLPRRLVQRDPLPDARNLATAPIPDSLGKHLSLIHI